MTQITAYAYEADYHCIECTVDYQCQCYKCTGACLPPGTEHKRDEHGVVLEAIDKEGNPIHPVFSTDELPTRLGDTFGDEMQWHEPIEHYTCGTCREQFSFLTGEMK